MYIDFETAWAEYEYIGQIVKNNIEEILAEDKKKWGSFKSKDDFFYHSVEISGNSIIIYVRPILSISALQEISNLLGVDGKILLHGTKKNAKMQI